MQLNRKLHGPPQTTRPPYELSVFDRQGRTVEFYELGEVYTGKLSLCFKNKHFLKFSPNNWLHPFPWLDVAVTSLYSGWSYHRLSARRRVPHGQPMAGFR